MLTKTIGHSPLTISIISSLPSRSTFAINGGALGYPLARLRPTAGLTEVAPTHWPSGLCDRRPAPYTIEKRAGEEGLKNISPVLCDPRSTKLDPDSVDLVFVCDTYHHFEYPIDTLASIHHARREDGRLVIVDFERIKEISSDWTLNHVHCGKGTVADEVKDSGFDLVNEVDLMEEQYVLVFQKRTPEDE